ncbi:hypothetical protein CRG98_000296, partial [Punica granatum]
MKVYSAAGTRVSDDEGWSLFFAEDDLHPGKTMSMRFIKSTNPVSFLPQKEAAFMPFSSRRLSEIFRLYSGKSGSAEAQKISYTIERCLGPSLVSTEDTSCVMSLESMVDFATTRLGNNLQVFNTEVKEQAVGKQDYTIQSRIKKVEGDRLAVCHKLHYPYAVFTCHSFKSTDSYPIVVPVKGPDGTTTEAIAVCHENTSEQNPEPLKMLNIKPGIVPLCHFLARDSIVQEGSNAGQGGITPATTEGTEKGLAKDKGKRKLSYNTVVAGDGEANMDIESEEPTGEGNMGVKQACVEMPVTEEIPMEMPKEISEPSSEEEEADPGFEFCPNIRFSKEQLGRFRAPWWGSLIVKMLGQRVGYKYLKQRLTQLWKRSFKLISLGSDFFLVRFSNKAIREAVIAGGPWTVLGHYLTIQQWRPNFVDLNKRLKSRFTIHGEEYKAAFESIHLVCFQCGRYGHRQEVCPELVKQKQVTPLSMSTNEGVELDKQVAEQESVMAEVQLEVVVPVPAPAPTTQSAAGPWMIVQLPKQKPCDSRRNKGEGDNNGKGNGQDKGHGSRFRALEKEDSAVSDREVTGGQQVGFDAGKSTVRTSGELKSTCRQDFQFKGVGSGAQASTSK